MARIFMKGNEAIAEAAIRCGCRFFFGYPITPQSDIPEYMSANLPKVGGVFVQPASEVAVSNMIGGAGATGARVMTSSSSVGIAHMQESFSNLAACGIPVVAVNISRGGPGVGNLAPNQADYNQATRGGGNGDYHLIVLSPSSVQEACDLVQLAFDLAEKYRNPALLLSDAMIGQMMEAVDIKYVTPPPCDKSWCLKGYDPEKGPRSVVQSLFFTEENARDAILEMQAKYERLAKEDVRWEETMIDDAEYIIVAHGIAARLAYAALDMLREEGIKAGMIRPVTLFPYPYEAIYKAAARESVKSVVCVEMSTGQMLQDVKIAVNGAKPVDLFSKVGGFLPMPEEVTEFVKGLEGK